MMTTVRFIYDLITRYVDGLKQSRRRLTGQEQTTCDGQHWEKELAFHGSNILHTLFGQYGSTGQEGPMESLSRELTWILVVWKL